MAFPQSIQAQTGRHAQANAHITMAKRQLAKLSLAIVMIHARQTSKERHAGYHAILSASPARHSKMRNWAHKARVAVYSARNRDMK
jgi:hypothetical protein